MARRIAVLLILSFAVPSLAIAGQITHAQKRKMKKWPDLERTLVYAYDAWMSAEEIDIVTKMKNSEERMSFMTELGWVKKWKEDLKNEDEIRAAIERQEVIEGMNQDQVFMAWDKPAKIRKDFRKDAYVNVLNYEFERDRKGKEFRLWPDSESAYRNEVFTRYVYMYNDKVFRIVDAGSEEDVMDDLPVEEPAPEPAPEAESSEGVENAAPAEGDEPAKEGDATPAPE